MFFHARRAVFAAGLAPVASGLVPAVSAPVQIFAGQAASVANLVRLSAVQLIFEILDIVQFPVELVDLPLQFVVVLFLRSQLLLQLLILAALRWIGTHVAYGERHSSNEDDAYPLLPSLGCFE